MALHPNAGLHATGLKAQMLAIIYMLSFGLGLLEFVGRNQLFVMFFHSASE
jgi:hypothetical protein